MNVTAHEDLWWACIVTSGALTFLVLAASLVTLSFLMAPVIERVFGRTGCEPRPFPVANPFHHATSLNASLRLSHDCLPASFLSKYLSSSPPPPTSFLSSYFLFKHSFIPILLNPVNPKHFVHLHILCHCTLEPRAPASPF